MRASPVAPVAVAPKSSKPKAPTPELRPAPLLEKADRRLLVEEIARLERLVATMSKKAPDRARIVLRLGDDYAELAKMAEREAIPPPRTIRF